MATAAIVNDHVEARAVELEFTGPNVDNTSGRSEKFWRAFTVTVTDKHYSVVQFGRIGTNGSTNVKTHPSASSAHLFISDKANEKRGKGYRTVFSGTIRLNPVAVAFIDQGRNGIVQANVTDAFDAAKTA